MTAALRMMGVALAAPFRPRLGLLGISRLSFRVLPNDLDYNIHMNNARYLALMDTGRVDLILRTGMWRAMWTNHWQAVIAGSLVRYRRPLKPFQRMELTSRLVGWDERWFYIDHRVAGRDGLSCQAMVRGAFLGNDGILSPSRLADALGEAARPELPGWIASWSEADRGFGQPAIYLEPEEA
jgi:acyl-CoA thioesterase FadM